MSHLWTAQRNRLKKPPGGSRRDVWPVLRGTPGFRSSMFLVDRTHEEVVTVTLWDSDEARRGADAAGPPDRRRVFEEIGVRRREARIFDVLGVEGRS